MWSSAAKLLREAEYNPKPEINYAIPDFGVPTSIKMKEILDAIDSAVSEGKMTYIHCLAGRGTTGTVVGCYLVRHGYPASSIISHIASLRKDLPTWWYSSPEAPAQVEFILNWVEGTFKPD